MPRHDLRFFLRSVLSVVLAGYCSCYSPDLSKVTVLCPSESPSCPAGSVCVSGVCTAAMDQGTAGDLSQTDLAIAALCPKGGDVIVGQARGCPGTFASGMASKSCPAGWAPCVNASKLGGACSGVASPFFASAVSGYWLGTKSQETCGSAAGDQLLFGCGVLGRASVLSCGGLPLVIDIQGAWLATDGTLGTASLTDATQGVLCCPP